MLQKRAVEENGFNNTRISWIYGRNTANNQFKISLSRAVRMADLRVTAIAPVKGREKPVKKQLFFKDPERKGDRLLSDSM
jgi:hypothetical protein